MAQRLVTLGHDGSPPFWFPTSGYSALSASCGTGIAGVTDAELISIQLSPNARGPSMSSHPFGESPAKLPPTRYANIVRRKRPKPPRPIAVDEHTAAAMLSITIRKLRNVARDHESLPSFKIGRTRMFRVVDLRRFLALQVKRKSGGTGE